MNRPESGRVRLDLEAALEEFLDTPMRIQFWVCPVPEHRDRRDELGQPLPTVEWRSNVAYCLAARCGRTSADPKP